MSSEMVDVDVAVDWFLDGVTIGEVVSEAQEYLDDDKTFNEYAVDAFASDEILVNDIEKVVESLRLRILEFFEGMADEFAVEVKSTINSDDVVDDVNVTAEDLAPWVRLANSFQADLDAKGRERLQKVLDQIAVGCAEYLVTFIAKQRGTFAPGCES